MISRVLAFALLILAAMLMAVGLCVGGEGYTVFQDNFEGGMGPVDPERWDVTKLEPTSNVSVLEGTMRMHVKGWDRITVMPAYSMSIYPYTVDFMWMQEANAGHTLEIQVANSADGENWDTERWFYYEAEGVGWYNSDPTRPGSYQWKFSDSSVEVGEWYHIALTIETMRVTMKVTHPGERDPLVEENWYATMDKFTTVKIGSWADDLTITASRIDDFGVHYDQAPPKAPIEVDLIPPQTVVEDVSRELDLTQYVHDPDGDVSDISIQTTDLHVTHIEGLIVYILCLEEGGTLDVRLTFTDGDRSTNTFLDLIVEGVNDPPKLTLVAPRSDQTLYDIEDMELEFRVTDPNSERWEAYWYVQGGDVDYRWEEEVTVGSSRHQVGSAPDIEPGSYIVTVTVSDGEAGDSIKIWVYVESTVPPPPQTTPADWLPGVLMIVLVLAVLVAIVLTVVGKGEGKNLSRAELDNARVRRLAKKRALTQVRDRRKVAPQRQASAQHRQRSAPRTVAPTPKPVYAIPTVKPPPQRATPAPVEPRMDWKVDSVQEFMDIIPNLPEGFPKPLWGVPQDKVGREMVATSTVGPGGIPMCYVGGKAFHADKRDLTTFLQPL